MKKLTKKTTTIILANLLVISLTAGLCVAAERLIVQDDVSNNVFLVDETGRLFSKRIGAGTKNPLSSFHLLDESEAWDRGLTIQQAYDSAAATVISIKRSRGTEAAPAAVQSGDNVAAFHGQTYDGTQWITPASFMFVTDGAVNAGSVPTAMIFKTGTINPTPERMRISSDGQITMSNLSGSGNAYVCVDANGVLFRSTSPCF